MPKHYLSLSRPTRRSSSSFLRPTNHLSEFPVPRTRHICMPFSGSTIETLILELSTTGKPSVEFPVPRTRYLYLTFPCLDLRDAHFGVQGDSHPPTNPPPRTTPPSNSPGTIPPNNCPKDKSPPRQLPPRPLPPDNNPQMIAPPRQLPQEITPLGQLPRTTAPPPDKCPYQDVHTIICI